MNLYKSEFEFVVSFDELDPMNVVWHGNYIRYMEKARCDMFSKLDYTYADMEADNYAYPVAKMKVKYIKPAFFNDILIVETKIKEIEPALIIDYLIYNKKTNDKIFKAQTMQIALDKRTKTTLYVPPKALKDKLENLK